MKCPLFSNSGSYFQTFLCSFDRGFTSYPYKRGVRNSGVSVIAGVISKHFFVVLAGDLPLILTSGVSVIAGCQ